MYSTPGGIARHCRLLCRALTEAGAGVTVVALHDRPDQSSDQTERWVTRYWMCEGRKSVFVRASLREALRRPALVICEHAHLGPVAWAAAKLAGAPLLFMAHGIEVWSSLSLRNRLPLRRADGVLCVSAFTARHIRESNGLSDGQTGVLYNCLDPCLVPRKTPAPRPSTPALLTVSRLTREDLYKGHTQVIDAMPALLARFPALTYDIVGDGDARSVLEARARDRGVSHAMRFHGQVPDADLANHYARASVFVMPSRAEGFGYVFLEAMAHGTPVIAGNEDASVEVISHGETGYTVDPSSVEAIAEAVAHVLGDAALRERMGQAARERVERVFGFDAFRAELSRHLEHVLAPPAWQRSK